MKIYGFQKLTLLDYPDHLAALVFTGGCNFRCPWCQNGSLIVPAQAPPFSEDDILRQLQKRAGMLEGVVITGGEPTLQPDLRDFLLRCRDLGYRIKLDTNGSRPDVLAALTDDGLLDYVAMDIKASPENYGRVIGIENFRTAPVEESVRYLLSRSKGSSGNAAEDAKRPPSAAANVPAGGSTTDAIADGSTAAALPAEEGFHYEFRTTVIPEFHTPEEMTAVASWIAGAENYYLQAYRDSALVPDHRFTEPDERCMQSLLRAVREILPQARLRGM